MFRNNVIKIASVFLSLSVLTIGFLVWWLSFGLKETKFAQAEIVGTPLRGYAWADTYGWISLNCRNTNICVGDGQNCTVNADCASGSCQSSCVRSPYFVGVDEATGHLDGYAWSDNVGWVSFRKTGICLNGNVVETNANGTPKNCETDTGSTGCTGSFTCQTFTPPNDDFNDPNHDSDTSDSHCKIDGTVKSCSINGSCMACYNNDPNIRQFFGWARVLSEASNINALDAGWIKLDGTNFDLKVDNTSTSQDPPGGEPWGDLLGWAWGGANSGSGGNATSGIGWISFNYCSDKDINCSGIEYKVTGRPEDLDTLKVERIKGNESYGLNINWSAGYPAYGATSYEVWRHNGQCYDNNQPLPINEDCDSDVNCSSGTCNLSLPYGKKLTVASGFSYDNEPLNLFITYNYVVRACNIFGCSKTARRSLKTSPIQDNFNFKATPICAATTAGDSYVDITWNKPAIVSLFRGSLDRYELEYCQLDATGDISKCGAGLESVEEGFWMEATANCNNLTYDIVNKPSTHSCRENLIDGRKRSKDFFVYRIRGVADRGTCLGGDNDGRDCTVDANCASGGGTCDVYKSTWAFSNTFRICPVGTSYQEQRPN